MNGNGKIKAIIAVDKKWGIGKKNDLLFRLPLDMKYFREKTDGKTVCMGYNSVVVSRRKTAQKQEKYRNLPRER